MNSYDKRIVAEFEAKYPNLIQRCTSKYRGSSLIFDKFFVTHYLCVIKNIQNSALCELLKCSRHTIHYRCRQFENYQKHDNSFKEFLKTKQ